MTYPCARVQAAEAVETSVGCVLFAISREHESREYLISRRRLLHVGERCNLMHKENQHCYSHEGTRTMPASESLAGIEGRTQRGNVPNGFTRQMAPATTRSRRIGVMPRESRSIRPLVTRISVHH